MGMNSNALLLAALCLMPCAASAASRRFTVPPAAPAPAPVPAMLPALDMSRVRISATEYAPAPAGRIGELKAVVASIDGTRVRFEPAKDAVRVAVPGGEPRVLTLKELDALEAILRTRPASDAAFIKTIQEAQSWAAMREGHDRSFGGR